MGGPNSQCHFVDPFMGPGAFIAPLGAALILFWAHRHNRILGGLPAGDLVSADNEERKCPVLISHR